MHTFVLVDCKGMYLERAFEVFSGDIVVIAYRFGTSVLRPLGRYVRVMVQSDGPSGFPESERSD